jgi:hypothetical protein
MSSSEKNGNGTRAVIYARVSSKEQQEGGFSIPAQLKLLRDYALTHGFSVAREFTDAETAKGTAGPPQAFLLPRHPRREDGPPLPQPHRLP